MGKRERGWCRRSRIPGLGGESAIQQLLGTCRVPAGVLTSAPPVRHARRFPGARWGKTKRVASLVLSVGSVCMLACVCVCVCELACGRARVCISAALISPPYRRLSVCPFVFQTSFSRGFTKNMKLEAVNPRNPGEVCVASVVCVKGRLMWLHLEGTSRC